MKSLAVVLLFMIAAGVGYLAYSEYQKRQFVADLADQFGPPRGLETPERTRNMIATSLQHSAAIKAAVTLYYEENQRFPKSLSEAGVSIDSTSLPAHVESILLLEQGEILISMDVHQLGLYGEVNVAALRLAPEPKDPSGLNWHCSANPPLQKHPELLFAACRP